MSKPNDPDRPAAPAPGDIAPGATVLTAVTHTGKPCRIVDNTASVDPAQLRQVLETLVRERRFGLTALSAKGGTTIALNRPIASHIQFGERLYRLLLFPYEARVEKF